jgi:hypothetical protein
MDQLKDHIFLFVHVIINMLELGNKLRIILIQVEYQIQLVNREKAMQYFIEILLII